MPRVTKKRQITLPADQCKLAGIKSGDECDSFADDYSHITIVKKSKVDANELKKGLYPDSQDNQADFIRLVREGLSGKWVKQMFQSKNEQEVLTIALGIAPENMKRLYQQKKLSSRDSERILDTLLILKNAECIFDELEMTFIWLKTPNAVFGGERPLDLFDTFKGRSLVKQVLRKIEHGEFS